MTLSGGVGCNPARDRFLCFLLGPDTVEAHDEGNARVRQRRGADSQELRVRGVVEVEVRRGWAVGNLSRSWPALCRRTFSV